MRLPKAENWTPKTTEYVIKRINNLFDTYEKYSNLDDSGKETSKIANECYLEGMRLQDLLPVDAKFKKLF